MSHGFRVRRAAGFAFRALALWLSVALVFWIAVGVMPRVEVPSFEAALLTTGLIALINALLWPLLSRLVLPLTVVTFGLASLALNAAIVAIAFDIVDGSSPPALGAILAAIVLAAALAVLTPALSLDDDARQLRLVRRRLRGRLRLNVFVESHV